MARTPDESEAVAYFSAPRKREVALDFGTNKPGIPRLRNVVILGIDSLEQVIRIGENNAIMRSSPNLQFDYQEGRMKPETENVSNMMLFCALMMVKNSGASLQQSVNVAPLSGNSKSLADMLSMPTALVPKLLAKKSQR